MPLAIAEQATTEGRLTLIETDDNHPVIRLQRRKEALGIQDAHLGLRGDNLERMLVLLQQAVSAGEDYAPYAAGEVTSLLCRRHSEPEVAMIRTRVEEAIARLHASQAIASPNAPPAAPCPGAPFM